MKRTMMGNILLDDIYVQLAWWDFLGLPLPLPEGGLATWQTTQISVKLLQVYNVGSTIVILQLCTTIVECFTWGLNFSWNLSVSNPFFSIYCKATPNWSLVLRIFSKKKRCERAKKKLKYFFFHFKTIRGERKANK